MCIYDFYSEVVVGMEDIKVNKKLHDSLITGVEKQIINLQYVNETYQRLLKTHSNIESKEMIACVLLTEIYNAMKELREFDVYFEIR